MTTPRLQQPPERLSWHLLPTGPADVSSYMSAAVQECCSQSTSPVHRPSLHSWAARTHQGVGSGSARAPVAPPSASGAGSCVHVAGACGGRRSSRCRRQGCLALARTGRAVLVYCTASVHCVHHAVQHYAGRSLVVASSPRRSLQRERSHSLHNGGWRAFGYDCSMCRGSCHMHSRPELRVKPWTSRAFAGRRFGAAEIWQPHPRSHMV